MIKFKIEGQPYEILDYLTIEQYVKIYKIKDFFNDQYFAAKLINLVCNVPLNDALECPFEEVNFLASNILNVLPTKHNAPFIDRIEIDGVKYGFIPNWKDMTFAEFVDLDTISTKKQDEILDALHILAAIMYRPVIDENKLHDYTIEPYEINSMKKRAEIFKKKMDIKVIIGAQFFFIKFANKFSNYSQSFSKMNLKMSIWDLVKMTWKLTRLIHKTNYKRHTGGFWSSTKLLRTILLNTNTSIKRN